ncbi:MAG: hypothetical protein PGMFKBFP_02957 [Anaerolineales bacterium]|nr:hypothetical protein [Anaerolineales bacterium]
MKKAISTRIWVVLFTNLPIFLISGCGLPTFATPFTPQPPTVLPPYIHYTAPEGSNIHLVFDYPSSWVFSEDKMQGLDFLTIGLSDPRFRTLPTPPIDPDYLYITPSDFGSITIWALPAKPNQTPDSELESRKRAYADERMMTLLSDYKITVDGYDAGVLEYQLNDLENYTSLMFVRRIFLVVDNQFYEIYYEVAVKDRGGDFDQGYEYFFNSIKIVP